MALTVAEWDVLVDYLGGSGTAADTVAQELENGTLATVPHVRFELLAAAREGRQENQVRQLLYGIVVLVMDERVADKAAEVRRTSAASGRNLSTWQCLTAAAAMVHSARLLTASAAGYELIPNLRLRRVDSGPSR